MANPSLSVPDQIRQLNDARKLVLGDVKYWGSVVKGILPIIGPNAPLEVRRWGADFLAEAFATPALPNSEKETMQIYVLETLVSMVKNEKEDMQVLKSLIQTAASVYPLAMRWIINNGYDTQTWERITSVKQTILQLWDSAPPSVKICCIKFLQRVVLAQTVTSGHDQRYPGTLDVSLDKVPTNHQTLNPGNLEAEASGLLDRMLTVLQESSDALIVDATLNSLSVLIRTRPNTSARIINSLLTFNPLRIANSPMTPRTKVMVKSMEKTTRMLMIHLSKRDPHNPMVPRMQQYVEGMMRTLAEVLDQSGKKRALEVQPPDNSDVKRQKTGPVDIQIPPMGPGPHSLADVFSLIGTAGLRTFDVSSVPAHLIAQITVNTLSRVDAAALSKAVDGVRGRLDTLIAAPVPEINPNTAPLGVDDDDDDDYEPDFFQAEDAEQLLNKLDGPLSAVMPQHIEDALNLRSFTLPQPPELTTDLALSAGKATIARILETMTSAEDSGSKRQRAGFRRLAASSGNRESWMTVLTRLATRSSTGLEHVKEEDGEDWSKSLGASIRDVLYNFIMEDFRKNIDIAVSWLNEEWYNDKMQHRERSDAPRHYDECVLRLIDGFLPYLHPQDKVLTRFLSEIPELNVDVMARIKAVCRDPSVTPLALTSLVYLVMMRPPVKEMALDTLQDIWTEYADAKAPATKWLTKFRPEFLEAQRANMEGSSVPAQSAAVTT